MMDTKRAGLVLILTPNGGMNDFYKQCSQIRVEITNCSLGRKMPKMSVHF